MSKPQQMNDVPHDASKTSQPRSMEMDHTNTTDEPMQKATPIDPLTTTEQQLPQVTNIQREGNHVPTTQSPQEGPSLQKVQMSTKGTATFN